MINDGNKLEEISIKKMVGVLEDIQGIRGPSCLLLSAAFSKLWHEKSPNSTHSRPPFRKQFLEFQSQPICTPNITLLTYHYCYTSTIFVVALLRMIAFHIGIFTTLLTSPVMKQVQTRDSRMMLIDHRVSQKLLFSGEDEGKLMVKSQKHHGELQKI